MPITVSSELTATGSSGQSGSPVVRTDFVVHLADELVAEARQAERDEVGVVICCRTLEQARSLADRLLAADIGSAVLTAGATMEEVAATVEAFGYRDFTALLVTDDLHNPWQVDPENRLLHADLPAPHGSIQVMATLNARCSHLRSGVRVA